MPYSKGKTFSSPPFEREPGRGDLALAVFTDIVRPDRFSNPVRSFFFV
jgi:hypothetical protein